MRITTHVSVFLCFCLTSCSNSTGVPHLIANFTKANQISSFSVSIAVPKKYSPNRPCVKIINMGKSNTHIQETLGQSSPPDIPPLDVVLEPGQEVLHEFHVQSDSFITRLFPKTYLFTCEPPVDMQVIVSKSRAEIVRVK